MKTAISLPDDLYARAEAFASSTSRSRSRLYQEALEDYLLRKDEESITSAMNRALVEIDQPEDEWHVRAGAEALKRSEW